MDVMIRRAAALAVVLAAFFSACSGDGGDEPTPFPTFEPVEATPATGQIEVVLGEWSVLPDAEQAAAGTVDLEINNDGRVAHELLVIGTDLDAGELPTTADGAVDTTKLEVIAEAKDIAPEGRADLAPDLDAGPYVLVCNIVDEADDGTTRAHYKLGMRTALVVQ